MLSASGGGRRGERSVGEVRGGGGDMREREKKIVFLFFILII